jgi:hypothetical protein
MRLMIAGLLALCAAMPFAVLADPPEGKGNKAHKHHDEGREDADESERGQYHGSKSKHAAKDHRQFGDEERVTLREYFEAHPREVERLPPGLAKKRARGRRLPPGWEKKLQRGEVIPDEVWVHRMPLPPEIVVKLAPPPPGVVIVRIHDHVVRAIEKTHEVLDELGLPHPPTPP